MEGIKGNVCSDKHIKSAVDLRNLADETENASIILKSYIQNWIHSI